MRIAQNILAILLCIVLVASSLLLVLTLLLRNRVFDASFYIDVIARPAYPLLVRQAILSDLERQSSYVGVPIEVLEAGLDDATLVMKQRQHVVNLAGFLNREEDFVKPEYPSERFLEPLQSFMQDYAQSHQLAFGAEQQAQLREVAQDAAAIVQTHITLVDLSQFGDSTTFQRMRNLILSWSRQLILLLIPWLLSMLSLILIYRNDWRAWLNRILISLWLAGSLLLVPSLVLERFQLHRRLALETPYLLFAISHLLHDLLQYLIVWGLMLFFLSLVALLAIHMTKPIAKRQARPIYHERHAG